MTESISQTQIVNDTNRFGKHKGSSSLGSRTRSLAAGNSTSGSMFIRRRSSSSSSLSSTSSTNTTTTATPTSTNTSNITTSTSTTATIPTTVTATTTAISNNNNNNNTLTSVSLPSSSTSVVYTIVLKPLNNQFPTKSLEISEHNKCKIGRQSNAKTTPKPLNGYFNSKVLSRSHALLWCQDHRVWIKDTKSSNGTFLNGKRLSPELEESEAFEIKTGDHIEFGIDITGEDGLILYHKVACDISVFNIPLDQIDFNTLQNFNIATGSSPQRKPESNGSQDRRGATISARSGHNGTFRNTSTLDHPSSPLSMEDTVNNRSKNWDVVLAKLEIELQRSQQVEKELMDMKGFISDANTYYTEEKTKKVDSLNILLQQQLYEAQNRIKEYSKKTKLQEQAMSAAQKQLLQLQKTIEKTKTNHSNGLLHGSDINQLRKELEQVRLQLDEEKINHHKELMIEKQKCVDYEEKCLQLEKKLLLLEKSSSSLKKQQDLISSNGQLPTGNQNNGFFMGFFDALQLRSVQILLGILLAIISALFYALIAI